jgi:hypothetical protein
MSHNFPGEQTPHYIAAEVWNLARSLAPRKEWRYLASRGTMHFSKRNNERLNNNTTNTVRSIGPLMVAQWLRYCATNRKVAGSIPDGITGIFHWHNPSDRTMALGSTQPITEMSTRSISWR